MNFFDSQFDLHGMIDRAIDDLQKKRTAAPIVPVLDSRKTVAALIDHTLLKPDATGRDVTEVCEQAVRYGFASVCVNAVWVKLVAQSLEESSVKTCATVGFPLGASGAVAKEAEAAEAVRNGASEIDMVINIGAIREKDYLGVVDEIIRVRDAARKRKALLKVIIETCLLTDEQKIAACVLSRKGGADFVKTSTGFSKAGATTEDIQLMRAVVGPKMGVKASGGIRTLADLKAMVAAGANRIGASASVAIVEEIPE